MARWSRFRRLFGPEAKADVDVELAFHVEMRARELIEQGVPPERARALALRRFGDYDRSREACVEISTRRERRMARTEYLTELRQDVGYALRMLRRAPGFTAVALTTLALGIGANSAIFSVVHSVLLAPLPFRDADRLYRVTTLYPDGTAYSLSAPDFMSVREQTRTFDEVEALSGGVFTMLGAGEPREVRGTNVSDGLLGLVGLPVALGRTLAPGENQPGRAGVAVLDHGFWQRQFGGDRSVLGRTVTIAGAPFEIVGVLAPGARLLDDADIYAPLVYNDTFSAATAKERRGEFLTVIARARPGIALAHVDDDLRRIGTGLQAAFRDTNDTLTFNARSLTDVMLGDVRTPLLVLLGAVGFVLLVACANVANLLLSRAFARQRELAVRAALGASRARIVRHLLGESLMLSFAGGALGVALAWAGVEWLQAMQPPNVPRLRDISIDWRVLLFSGGACMTAGVLAGLAPVVGIRRFDLQRTLSDAARGSAGGGTMWGRGGHLRRLLVAAQIALATVLLVGAGLLVRTVAHLQRVPPGFDATRVLTLELTLTGQKYPNGPAVLNAYRDLWTRLENIPGVESAGGVSSLPLSGYFAWGPITVEGRVPPPGENFINADMRWAGHRYFETMRVPLRQGRFFGDQDTADAMPVAIVDEFMANELWPGQDALGKRIRFGDLNSTAPWQTVVGVVGRVKQYGLETDGRIALYRPHTQQPGRSMYIAVRTAGDPNTVATAVRRQIRDLDANLPIYRMRPMTALVDASLARQRFSMQLLGVFGLLALTLAAIGTYGVMAHVVTQGTRELGIRLALGATNTNILGMVLRHGLAVAAAGLIVGLAAAALLTRLIATLIVGVTARDPLTFTVAAVALAAAAAMATLVPALRASRVDPVVSLRSE